MKFIVNAFNGNEKLWKVLVIGSIPLSLMSLLPETYKPNTLEIVVVSTYSILLSIPVFKCGLKYNYYIFLFASMCSLFLFLQPIAVMLEFFGLIKG